TPPASATSIWPARMARVASTSAAAPDAQASDTVTAGPRAPSRRASAEATAAGETAWASISGASRAPSAPKRAWSKRAPPPAARGGGKGREGREAGPPRLGADEDADPPRRRVERSGRRQRLLGRPLGERPPPVALGRQRHRRRRARRVAGRVEAVMDRHDAG